jgi:lipid-A-disaccharide synthase
VKIFISAGEPSGDIRASELVNSFKKLSKNLEFYGMGSIYLKNEGVHLVYDFKDTSILGIQEAIVQIRKVLNSYKIVYREALNSDLVILVDYPGFHLKLASDLIKAGKKNIFYYILPQIWAWGLFRIETLRKLKGLYSILPFEVDFFKRYGLNVKFFGHPLKSILNRKINKIQLEGKPVIGLLPGSRKDEIRRLIPRFLKIKKEIEKVYKDAAFLLSLVRDYSISESENLKIIRGNSLEIINSSDILIVASGTASLESAILKKPAIVVYTTSELTFLIGKLIVKVPYISLTNLILNEMVYPEFIQHIKPKEITKKVIEILENPEKITNKLNRLDELLGQEHSTDKIAIDILEGLKAPY